MLTITRSSSMRILSKLILTALCVLCLQFLCSCANESGEEGVVDHVVKYANSRVMLDMSASCVVGQLPDAKVETSVLGVEDSPSGNRVINLEPAVVSDTMASWGADEWAENRDDLFFNLVAHFNVICKQAHEFCDVPEDYTVTCPEYMVVYDSQKNAGFIVTSTGVYRKTADPQNPIGEAIVLTGEN